MDEILTSRYAKPFLQHSVRLQVREAFIVESFATRRLKECLQQPTDDERRHMAYGMGMGMEHVGGVPGESGQIRSQKDYPLVMTNIANWKITIFNGKTHYKWPCSIAMLVDQRVFHFSYGKSQFLIGESSMNGPLAMLCNQRV